VKTAYAPGTITIIDEFAPHRWLGPNAAHEWAADYDKHAAATGVTDGVVKYDAPTRSVVDGDTAYVIIPALYTYKEHGKPMPLVVVEAMASGLPVVATRCGGIPEMLADGGGILVARNSAVELADALELLATNIMLRRRLAQEAHASFQKSFTWEAVRGNYRRILESVQSSGASSSPQRQPASLPMPMEVECKNFQTSA